MSLSVGIVGLPNVGKSTLFNALTKKQQAAAENYPFCTIEPNSAIVEVQDPRLEALAAIAHPQQIIRATVEFTDIAGLVKGASQGEGLGNKFLANIRECDAILHVVRCFENDDIVHVEGSIDPARDIETINLELILSDAEILDRRLEKTKKAMKADKSLSRNVAFYERVKEALDNGLCARTVEVTEDEQAMLDELTLLTAKPVIYACNMSEEDFVEGIETNARYNAVCRIAEEEGSQVLPICAEMEAEIASLSKEEKAEFLSDLGIEQGGLDLLIQRSYDLLGLMSFLTAGEPEVRAWTIKKGTKAPKAAGKIHTDIERGFIRAEVINYKLLLECGSTAAAREKGLIRSEGKDYIMQDGDVVLFRFNV